jgi:hypothetical protein
MIFIKAKNIDYIYMLAVYLVFTCIGVKNNKEEASAFPEEAGNNFNFISYSELLHKAIVAS